MSVNLCIDWGNSNIKAAIFNDNSLVKKIVCTEEEVLDKVTILLDQEKPVKAILCAVAGETAALEALVSERIKTMVVLDGHTRTPINNAYLSADTLGADRLALVNGAYGSFPDKNNLVISMGTCVTYNLMQKNKTFRGGAIAPGMQMRLSSMHSFTDRLPEVEANGDLMLLGYDTETCMRSGAIFGLAAEIDGMIKNYETQFSDFNAILTGGDAPFFASKIKSKIFADPDLLLKGLNLILNYNVSFPR